ncbi:MAG: DUF1634 domain-containing protein [Gemmataceae bacterium]|nr:DUF1634 domain-containing protein [Gemmataceae bacterium]
MSAADQRRREERFEQFLGALLRVGVILAASVVLLGGVLYLARHGGEPPEGKVFRGEPADLRDPAAIVQAAAGLDGRDVIQLGLLLLIATPVARVGCSVVGFLRERDPTYVVLTLIVLSVLLYTLIFR